MGQAIPSPQDCCSPCDEPVVTNIPGPQGDAGADGADGADGVNAFTLTTATFDMPAEAANVTVSVANSTWMAPGQKVFAGKAASAAKGTFEVVSLPDATSAILKNIEDTATSAYTENSAPGTTFPSSTKISPAGLQGPPGTDGVSGAPTDAKYIVQTADAALTDAQALSALVPSGLLYNTTGTGVLSIASDGTHYLSPTTGLEPADIAVTVQAYDAFLTSIALLGTAANKIVYTTGVNTAAEADISAFGRSLIDDATAAAARETVGKVLPRYGMLGSVTALDLNVGATDTAVAIEATKYRIDKVMLETPSAAVTTATAGVFTAAGGGGVTLAADQALVGTLTATTKFMDLVLQAICGTDHRTETTLYARVGTAEGSACTVNVKIFGWRFD